MRFPHRRARVGGLCGFRSPAERVPIQQQKTGRCAAVKQHCGNGKRRRRASNLPTNNFQSQYNSSTSEYKSLPQSHCLFMQWLFFMLTKEFFQNGLFKTRFSVGLNRRIFSEGREQAAQARKCKWSVNFIERASKNCVPVAYAVRGFFSRGHRSKHKTLSDQIEGVIAGRKISSLLNKKICEGG